MEEGRLKRFLTVAGGTLSMLYVPAGPW